MSQRSGIIGLTFLAQSRSMVSISCPCLTDEFTNAESTINFSEDERDMIFASHDGYHKKSGMPSLTAAVELEVSVRSMGPTTNHMNVLMINRMMYHMIPGRNMNPLDNVNWVNSQERNACHYHHGPKRTNGRLCKDASLVPFKF
ncbi:hypothetical protein BDR07DRAFT_781013 [Suillus spraguei]|nr:hypothetical protein BDR07DRAFT_781013 [Suillus spraguei]